MTGHLQRFFAELQRRKVLRLAAAYVVGAWIVLQVAVALQTAMSLSASFSATILGVLVIGFFVTLVLAWFYEITPEGVKRTAPATGDAPLVKPQTTDLILAGALALVVVVAVVQLLSPVAPVENTGRPTETTSAEASPKKTQPAIPDEKSVVVLPLVSLSPDKEDAFFADGLTEEILSAVAQVRGLRVVSRTSAFAFKGKDTPLKEIAQQLSVRYALEGSVRREGDDMRITAQLIDVPNDAHIWSKTYERRLEQVFAVQNEIANEIALALEVEIRMPVDTRGAPTNNMKAHRLYLEGQEVTRRGTIGDTAAAGELYKQALELDPKFAKAYAALAGIYLAAPIVDQTQLDTALSLAQQNAEMAHRLDPTLAGPFHVLGSLDAYALRWEDALSKYAKAIELDPSHSYAFTGRGVALQRLGWLKDGHRLLLEGRRIDPLNNQTGAPLAFSALARSDDQVVETMARKILVTRNEYAVFSRWILMCLAQEKGNYDEADREFRAFVTARGRNKDIIGPVSRALKSRSAIPAALRVLRAEAEKDPTFQFENLLFIIDPQDAWIDALNERLARKETYFVSFWLPGIWRVVNNAGEASPKMKQLMRNAGLVDYWKKHGWPDRCRAKGEDDFECS